MIYYMSRIHRVMSWKIEKESLKTSSLLGFLQKKN